MFDATKSTLLTATKPQRYKGRDLLVGDSFEATRTDARVLIAIGRAAVHVPPPPPAVEDEDSEEKRAKRAYKRRDLKVED